MASTPTGSGGPQPSLPTGLLALAGSLVRRSVRPTLWLIAVAAAMVVAANAPVVVVVLVPVAVVYRGRRRRQRRR